MKTTTRSVLLPLLQSDDTITPALIDAAIRVLEGKSITLAHEENTELISKAEAARLLGWSRTTLYTALAQDRVSGSKPRFLEIETTLGNFQLRKCDVIALHNQLKGRKRGGA